MLIPNFNGQIITPDDPEYDSARTVFIGPNQQKTPSHFPL